MFCFALLLIVIWNKALTSHNQLNIQNIAQKLPVLYFTYISPNTTLRSHFKCSRVLVIIRLMLRAVRGWGVCIIIIVRRNWIISPPGVSPWVTGALGQSDPSNQGISGGGMFQFSDKQVRLEKLVTPGEIITMLDPTSHWISNPLCHLEIAIGISLFLSRFVNIINNGLTSPHTWPPGAGHWPLHCTGDTGWWPPARTSVINYLNTITERHKILEYFEQQHWPIVSQYFYQKVWTKTGNVTSERCRDFYRKFHLWACFSSQFLADVIFTGAWMKLSGGGRETWRQLT